MSNENRVDAQCIEVQEIAVMLDLPAGDPVRRHVETCPRCRSLVASYQSFVEAAPVQGADLERVRGILDARIRSDASRWKSPTSPARAFRWRTLLRPMPLVAAGLVVVAAAVFWTTRGTEQSSLRDSTTQTQAFALNPAQIATNGNIQLSWSAATGADKYQVRLYGPDFGEIYRSANTAETSLAIDRSTLPADLPPALDLTWRVFALSQGDVIATSAPGSIRTR